MTQHAQPAVADTFRIATLAALARQGRIVVTGDPVQAAQARARGDHVIDVRDVADAVLRSGVLGGA